MRNALVTGSSGFIGRHMVRRLKADGWNVVSIDVADAYFPQDAVDFFATNRAPYDLVVHCAYTVGGRVHIDGVNMAFADNLTLDAALFNWAVRTKPGAVIYYSSSAAYPTYLQTKAAHKILAEDDLDLSFVGQPDNLYGLSKVVGEHLARMASAHGVRVHVLRPFSGYCGVTQSLDYPFPSIVKRARAGDLSVWGPPGQCRDWVFIDDVISASLAVYDNDERRPVNLATGRGVEMGDLARMVFAAANPGCDVPPVVYDESKPTGVFYRVGDSSRMLEHWTPTVSVEEAIIRALQAQEV